MPPEPLLVSLATVPPRLLGGMACAAAESLLDQTVPTIVVLSVALRYWRFGATPGNLTRAAVCIQRLQAKFGAHRLVATPKSTSGRLRSISLDCLTYVIMAYSLVPTTLRAATGGEAGR